MTASAHPDHWIVPDGRTYAILSRRGVEIEGIETRGSAEDHLAEMEQELADQAAADAAAIEAEAFEAALDEIAAWVNAQGGTAAANDPAALGRVRAVAAAQAALDAIGTAACEDRRAAA